MASNPPTDPPTNPPPAPSATYDPPFTPRSSSFPDNIDSDEEDIFDPTPVHSPAGPHYHDLPPSYDEAQQQALQDARNVPPPHYDIPADAEVHAHRATAHELSQQRNRTVPVQHLQNSNIVPVGRITSAIPNPTTIPQVDQASRLLNTALQFTKHEPDADAEYAPHLTRPVAIPQNVSHFDPKGKARAHREEKKGNRKGRTESHVPGASSATPTVTPTVAKEERSVQFLRVYAKALHAHSIRPAEFLDFIDGLNALCIATGCTPTDLTNNSLEDSNQDTEIVRSYLSATNEAFFAPRGLRVTLQSFTSLLDAAKIPMERGQRAGAIASVEDPQSTPLKRAQALHPWIEPLEANSSEPSVSAIALKGMAEQYKNTPASTLTTNTTNDSAPIIENEKTRLEREYAERDRAAAENDDPPHSIPGEYPADDEPSRPPSEGWRGRGARGQGGPWANFGPRFTPFGSPGHGPHGPPGFTPFGPPGHGPHGPPVPGAWGQWGSQRQGRPNSNNNGWEAIGESIGKWGEEFGRRMEAWGDQFAKEAEEWGNDLGNRASGASTSRCTGRPAAGPSGQRATGMFSPPEAHPTAGLGVTGQQETGVHHESHPPSHVAIELEKHTSKKAEHRANDDDASSISSSSSSDSDSDSDSDTDDEDFTNQHSRASSTFNERIRDINATADAARAKGKKAPDVIERERALAIEKAAKDKATFEEKIEQKRTKRTLMREFRTRRRDLKREGRQARRDLKRQGLGKKTKEWKNVKKSQRDKKKALRMEKNDVRRQFKEARKTERSEGKGKSSVESEDTAGESVWIVMSNL
ncbi:hypothetical protein GRF29_164g1034844 [Pseudopithomyces chartarum]|uniref:Uncharacterized protein n=1 Tax=Pseudopithomyces chartarum TaxID=1892770 RepID=A0AAN6LTJ9_9PLEO|nr:hypothetical protein GRF29_164g1034844 [Pseudopithomyces chartarum]